MRLDYNQWTQLVLIAAIAITTTLVAVYVRAETIEETAVSRLESARESLATELAASLSALAPVTPSTPDADLAIALGRYATVDQNLATATSDYYTNDFYAGYAESTYSMLQGGATQHSSYGSCGTEINLLRLFMDAESPNDPFDGAALVKEQAEAKLIAAFGQLSLAAGYFNGDYNILGLTQQAADIVGYQCLTEALNLLTECTTLTSELASINQAAAISVATITVYLSVLEPLSMV